MGALGEITFADIARALGRYRPVAFTVLAIIVLVAVLPGHRPPRTTTTGLASAAASRSGGGIRASAPAPAAGTEVAGASSPESAAPAGGTIGDSTYSSSSSTNGSLGSSSSFTESPPTTSYSYAPPSESSGSSGDDSSSTPTTSGIGGGDGAGPYTVSAATWSTATGAGTPLGSAGVPAGDLPVGTHLGSDDKRSFVRLTGGGSKVLTLKVDAAGARAPVNGTAAIRACQITAAGWTENPGSSFADEPDYDDGSCVSGKPSSDGTTWTFALSSFANPADARGVALVPDKTSATDFQVTFTR